MRISRRFPYLRTLAAVLCAAALGETFLPCTAVADIPGIAYRQRTEKKAFTDSEIVEGFLKIAFGAEYHLAGRVDRIRKFDGPVRVYADGTRADRKAQLAKIVADIAARVQHLDIAMAGTIEDANVQVKLVRDRDLQRTITTFYGSERAKEIRSSLDPQCLSGFRKNEKFEIEHSDVILTVDNGDFVFFDCAYEELLQSLGPINDTASVPWTMFNDNVSMGYFDVYDQYLLNLLYDPRIKAGMTVQEVKTALPDVLADVRAWVRKVNNLP
jgi:acylphosphatase